MATRFCTQCGSEVAEGKRFCSRCGAAIGEKAQKGSAAEAISAPIENAAPGALGKPSPLPIFAVPVSAPVSVSAPVPAPEPLISAVVATRPQVETPVPKKLVREKAAQHMAATQSQIGELRPSEREVRASLSEPEVRRSPRPWIAAGLAALILVAGGSGLYAWHKKKASETAAETAKQPGSLDMPQVPPNFEPPAKPDADVPALASAATVPVTPQPETKPLVSPPLPPAAKVEAPPPSPKVKAYGSPAPVLSERAAPAPITREAPASEQGGVLHYSGPPIHFGEVVTFSGLPGAMLRFSFDHAAWQPRISHLPDGTQTLTLRSLSQQEQTQCEVRWEIAR